MSKLALLGGKPIISENFRPYQSIGDGEKRAVMEVLDSGSLSGFYGSWDENFLGGATVKRFEKAWSEKFEVKHSVSVNSNTSGLYAAMGAIGVSPEDEVIVSPFTMSATAAAPLGYGAIPVFADIEDDTFCLDVEAVKEKITDKTHAIIATNLFGHPAKLRKLRNLCDSHGIYLIEDAAQCPMSKEGLEYSGTIGHIGVFSLNYHKHIHTGEGGICVTNDDHLALRLQMIRNHAEAVVEPAGVEDLTNMFGHNFRLTEMSAAVGLAQLESIDLHINKRVNIAKALDEVAVEMSGLTGPMVREECSHVYYIWAAKWNSKLTGVSRKTFSKALAAEGFPHFEAYLKPLYLLPLFQKRVALGREGFPFNKSTRTYQKGMCPVVERMHFEELLCFEPCFFNLEEDDVKLLQEALMKTYENLDDLRTLHESVKA